MKCANCQEVCKQEDLEELEGIGMVCKSCANTFEICDICGKNSDDLTEVHNGDNVCTTCLEEYYFECPECEEYHKIGEVNQVDIRNENGNEDTICEYCAIDYEACTCCGRVTHPDNLSADGRGTTLCNHCQREHTECNECGCWIPRSHSYSRRGYHYCETCFDHLPPIYINDYDYRPDPTFFGTGPRYRGIELEIDKGGEDTDKAKRVQDIVGSLAYIKHDGSLHNGFEIVTEPCSVDYHKDSFPWDKVTRKCIEMGYQSHKAQTCGLHVHMSRLGFGRDYNEQDLNISKLLLMFEINWDKLVTFSRRSGGDLSRWANRYGITHDEKELLNHAKRSGRYFAVNLQPSNTVEIRIFRGTLKVSTIIASIQLCDVFNELAMTKTIDEVRLVNFVTVKETAIAMGFTELVSYIEHINLTEEI